MSRSFFWCEALERACVPIIDGLLDVAFDLFSDKAGADRPKLDLLREILALTAPPVDGRAIAAENLGNLFNGEQAQIVADGHWGSRRAGIWTDDKGPGEPEFKRTWRVFHMYQVSSRTFRSGGATPEALPLAARVPSRVPDRF